MRRAKNITVIFETAKRMKDAGQAAQAYLYITGCYASQAPERRILRECWADMRRIINEGFTVGSLAAFSNYYYKACCNIGGVFGFRAWEHTLTFDGI